jgi:hypothetical protein
MANWLEYFFGGGKEKQPAQIADKAEPLFAFPSKEDARFALQQGLGYGSGYEPYIEGKRAHVYDRPYTGEESAVLAAPSENLDLTQYRNLSELGKINTLHAQTALAVNRNPIAALGYDPHQVNLQTKIDEPLTHGGMYSRDQDRTWVNVEGSDIPSSATHEAIHRGLYKVAEKEPWMNEVQKAQADEARKLLKELPGQEDIVRYTMAEKLGDPELDTGPISNEQRQSALNKFRQRSYYFGASGGRAPMPEDISAEGKLRRLEELAAEQRKNRRPGGPR